MKRFKKDINPANGKFEVPMAYVGRSFTLMKREQSAEAPWYLRMEHKGKAYWRSTDTADAELAQTKAKRLIDAILKEDTRLLEATKLRDPLKYATLGQVIGIYRSCAPIIRRTIGSNVSALGVMIRSVRGEDVDVSAVTTDTLTGKMVREFQSAVVEKVRKQKLPAAAERTALARAQRSANSTWTQARSVFVPGMMAKYLDSGLVFPEKFETDFLRTPRIKGVERVRYTQPPDKLIQATIAAARGMMAEVLTAPAPKAEDQLSDEELAAQRKQQSELHIKDRMAVAFVLMMGCGLRKGEVMLARGGWIGRVNEQLYVTLPAEVTKNKESRRLRLPAEFEAFLTGYVTRHAIGASDRLLSNAEKVTRATSAWLRSLGWTGSKTNHALRKYFGYLVARKFGMEAAQWALDHADIATTQQSYVGMLKSEGVVVELPTEEKIVVMPKSDDELQKMARN